MLRDFVDIHTHRPDAPADAVINLDPGMVMEPGRFYSAGVHPWLSDSPDAGALFYRVQALAGDPHVVMIGECGVDTRRGASTDVQLDLLRRQAEIAESVGKPLLLHVVGAFPQVIGLRRSLRPGQPWIVHGFRGKPQLAAELLRHGFRLSLGERFNPASAAMIPAGCLYTETDTSSLDIGRIRALIDAARSDLIFEKK